MNACADEGDEGSAAESGMNACADEGDEGSAAKSGMSACAERQRERGRERRKRIGRPRQHVVHDELPRARSAHVAWSAQRTPSRSSVEARWGDPENEEGQEEAAAKEESDEARAEEEGPGASAREEDARDTSVARAQYADGVHTAMASAGAHVPK